VAPRSAARTASRRPARVLLVDDLTYVRDALAELLRGAGYDVVSVPSGPAALSELERQGVDVLLTDLYMPEMTGWDLVRAVRSRNVTNTRGLPVCVGLYSAVLSGFSRDQLARAQVDFALTKLSDPEAILEAVERALAWSEID
jgi:CheY-like chemotaxis protein